MISAVNCVGMVQNPNLKNNLPLQPEDNTFPPIFTFENEYSPSFGCVA